MFKKDVHGATKFITILTKAIVIFKMFMVLITKFVTILTK